VGNFDDKRTAVGLYHPDT